MAFIPPQGNKTVMVDSSNNIVYPASFNRISVNQATIAGNNFTDVPSVIDPENATPTQLPTVESVVSYVADVVEGGSSGLIPAIQSNIQTLRQTKSNRGEFYFNGGSLACSNKWTNSPFSLALTFSMTPAEYDLNAPLTTSDYQWLGTSVYGTGVKGFCLSLDVIGTDPRCVCIFFGATRTTSFAVENFKGKYCDGKPHSLFVILNSTTAIVQIDDDIYSANAPDYDGEINTKPFSIFKNTARFSRIKYFNFDMSDANAPYTIADYIAGKDESPLLKNGRARVLDNTHPSWEIYNSSSFDLLKDSTADTLTATCIASNNYLAISEGYSHTAKVGDVISVSWDNIEIPTGISVNSVQFKANGITVATSNNESHIIPKDSEYIILQFNFSNNVSVGDVITITGLKIRVNGALLSLDDYSIKVGATQIVPDVSGNNNDATITGAVYGSKDNSIAKMAQLFYQSQQG